MEYRTLGSTGTEVSELCFGTWRFGKESGGVLETDREQAHRLLDAAAEAGINFIDTANVYGDVNGTSENWIGEWLADRDREKFVLASKVYFEFDDGPNNSGLGRKHIRDQIEGTLDRLGTSYLDVYYIHRWDESTPVEETLQTLDGLVDDGLVNHLGASTMAAWQLTKALWTSDVENYQSFDVTQPRFNAAYRDPVSEYLDVCESEKLAVCPYSPLEGGFLTGKYDRETDAPENSRAALENWDGASGERAWSVLDAVQSVASELDATPAQVALRWLIEREAFTCVPIVGARTVGQLEENVQAAELSLSAEQRERIEEASQ